MLTTLEVAREAVRQSLWDFRERPFFNVRESDVQACLMIELRRQLQPSTVAVEVIHHPDVRGRHDHGPPGRFQTSRVHMELKADPTGSARTDVVVFTTERPARLTCYPAGGLDIVAAVNPEDVDVVIELKASPSKTQTHTYREDLQKLAALTLRYPHLRAIFTLHDKSLRTDGITSSVESRAEWLEAARTAATHRVDTFYIDGAGDIALIEAP